ncbi:hypothetical protein CP533_5165 [Ophiocordyceps camponoti-saundersi (nom. inval.)]|nr:hypothetical protein CP533_5165 [Ophiocordyceps camponoti-saundersi (nom. inval.)]
MDISGLDPDSIHLVVELLKEDIEGLKSRCKGKYREGEVPDSELAINAFESELESLESLISDRSMCMSIARAVSIDGGIIQREQLAENRAAQDHQIALQVSSHPGTPIPSVVDEETESISQVDEAEDELLFKLQALYIGYPEEDELDQAESSSWAATRSGQKMAEPTTVCTCCGDQHVFYDVARCPCKHEYCRECLASLFTASIGDESLFPSRCCKQPIPIEPNQVFLPSELVGKFKAKKIEFETPNRTYCYEPTCSTFVPLQFIKNDVATCTRCAKTTCTICKQMSHRGDCPKDPAVQELLRIAAANQWQHCYSCARLVELAHGCNHITCICRAEFCYVCGRPWKTCGCETWDEHRLLARAEAVVNRDVGALFDDEGRARRIQQAANYLMENHECDHDRWRGRGGEYRCEECHHWLDRFIYECRQCRIQVCRRCRFNRL